MGGDTHTHGEGRDTQVIATTRDKAVVGGEKLDARGPFRGEGQIACVAAMDAPIIRRREVEEVRAGRRFPRGGRETTSWGLALSYIPIAQLSPKAAVGADSHESVGYI